jgi:hypothetical protein
LSRIRMISLLILLVLVAHICNAFNKHSSAIDLRVRPGIIKHFERVRLMQMSSSHDADGNNGKVTKAMEFPYGICLYKSIVQDKMF